MSIETTPILQYNFGNALWLLSKQTIVYTAIVCLIAMILTAIIHIRTKDLLLSTFISATIVMFCISTASLFDVMNKNMPFGACIIFCTITAMLLVASIYIGKRG